MKLLWLIFNLVIFLLPAFGVTRISKRYAATSVEEWQILAWVPSLPLIGWGIFIAIGVTMDPTSHNLWPFELAMWGFLTFVLFALFRIARRIFGGTVTDPTAM